MIKKLLKIFSAATALSILLTLCSTFVSSPSVSALSASDWQAGRIIDDSVFYDPNSMSISQIQAFLNAKVPVCDTWGTQMRGNVTRAQYGTSNGNPPPYTCLKDFRQTTTAKPYEAGICNGYGVADHSAADIIYTVAQSCGVSAKVLLTLLQKEQAIVTDDWPWTSQYRSATGFGCPDTAACDSQYYGFFNQVYDAARGFKTYAKYANSFNYIAGRNNFLRYSPDSNCGGSTVFIQNQATAGLYNYTPYQPNTAALANMNGTGDNCSAYGNRNFWRMFFDWFGSTSDNIPISYTVRMTSAITLSPSTPIAGEPVTMSFTVKNFDPNNAVTLQAPVVQCRLVPNTSCDPPYNSNVTLAPNQSYTFNQTITTMQTGGTYSLVPYFLSGGVWYRYGTDTPGGNYAYTTMPGMRLTSPITLSPSTPQAGDTMTVSYNVKNMGIAPVNYQTSVLQCRVNTSTNCDSDYGGATTFQPGEERTVTATLPSLRAGSYDLTPYYLSNGVWYKYGLWGAQANAQSLVVPDVRLVGNMTSNPTQPIPGQPTTVSYTVHNYGSNTVNYQSSVLQCRINNVANCDSSYDTSSTLAAGAERTFTINLPAVKAGVYTMTPYFLYNNNWYKYALGTASSNQLTLNVPAYVADMRMTAPLTITPAQPIPGQAMSVTYKVKNFGTLPGIFQTSILQCRINTYTSCDPAYDAPYTINAGTEKTFTVNFPAARAGTYTFTPYYTQNDTFYRYDPGTIGSSNVQVAVPSYVAPMELTGPITTSPASPTAGQAFTASYTVHNTGTAPAIFQTSILQCRFNTYTNCDPAYDAPQTIAAGATKTFTVNFPAAKSGTYTLTPFYAQNDNFYTYSPAVGSSSQLRVNVP